jgi:hypothetical protein
MTRKDFQLIASVLAKVESWLAEPTCSASVSGPESVLDFTTRAFMLKLRETNPRFDAARFEAAAMPLHSERLRQSIIDKLAQ